MQPRRFAPLKAHYQAPGAAKKLRVSKLHCSNRGFWAAYERLFTMDKLSGLHTQQGVGRHLPTGHFISS